VSWIPQQRDFSQHSELQLLQCRTDVFVVDVSGPGKLRRRRTELRIAAFSPSPLRIHGRAHSDSNAAGELLKLNLRAAQWVYTTAGDYEQERTNVRSPAFKLSATGKPLVPHAGEQVESGERVCGTES